MKDERYIAIRKRLERLTSVQLNRILNNLDILCVDEFNYDEDKDMYCVLALAHNLHKTIEVPTNKKIVEYLSKKYKPVNIIKGLPGEFYTKKRKEDIKTLCEEILKNKYLKTKKHEKSNRI